MNGIENVLDELLNHADYVITLCGDAIRKKLETWLRHEVNE